MRNGVIIAFKQAPDELEISVAGRTNRNVHPLDSVGGISIKIAACENYRIGSATAAESAGNFDVRVACNIRSARKRPESTVRNRQFRPALYDDVGLSELRCVEVVAKCRYAVKIGSIEIEPNCMPP